MTDPLGQSQVIPYLKGLKVKGFKIYLISVEKPEKFIRYRSEIDEILNELEIKWFPLKYKSRIPFVSGSLNIRNMFNKALKIVSEEKIQIIHARAAVACMTAYKIWKRKKIPFIFDMRGFWADEKVDGNLWDLNKRIHKEAFKYLKRKEKQFLLNAAHIVSLTHKGKEIIHARPEMENLPITVIPCCADLDFFNFHTIQNEERFKTRNELNITPETIVLNYLGSWGTWYMPEEMMRCFAQLLQLREDAVFLIITQDEKEVIIDCAKRNNVPLEKIIIRSAKR